MVLVPPPEPRAKKGIARVLGIILPIFVFVIAGCGFVYWAMGELMCGTDVFQEAYSLDNEYKVVLFERNCGATTNFSTNLSILRASQDLPNKPGNIFQMDDHPDWTKAEAVWTGDRSILVVYFDGSGVYRQKSEYRNLFTIITVEYDEVPRE